MPYCNGDGSCLMKCNCICYNKETGKEDEMCVCSHREHNGYCPNNCCVMIKCMNHVSCTSMKPKWIFDYHNGFCINCHFKFTKYKSTNIINVCPICLENKNMILLNCKHKMCEECWDNITKKGFSICEKEYITLCTLCRDSNNDSK